MYTDFLKNKSQSYESRHCSKEYILMAKNRISDINKKLKEHKKES